MTPPRPLRPTLLVGLATAALILSAWAAGAQAAGEPAKPAFENHSVGPCPQGGSLAKATAPLPQYPHQLVAGRGMLRAEHRALAAREQPWARDLLGVASENRVYTSPTGARVLVFETCKPRDCGDNRLYGARTLGPKPVYGLVMLEAEVPRTLGSFTAPMQAALACVREFELRQKGVVNRAIDTHAPAALPR